MARRRARRGNDEPVNVWNTFFFKFGSKFLLGILVILVFLTLVQCTVNKPESPTWNTTFVVPVVNRTYPMEELIDRIDQDEITMDSTGDISFSITEDLDTVSIGQSDLSVPDLSYSVSEVLGVIRLDSPAGQDSTIGLDALTQGLTIVPGTDSVVVPANTPFAADNDRRLDSYNWAYVSSGTIKVKVTNQLGLTLYDVVVRLVDRDNAEIIDTGFFVTPLTHNATDSILFSLGGRQISDSLSVSVVGHSDPVAPTIVGLTGKLIRTSVSFPEAIEVTSAEAKVPALDDLVFSQRVGLELDGGETIDSAILEAGYLNLSITNNTEITCTLFVSVPSLSEFGTPLTITRQVPGQQTVLVNTDLTGYVMTPVNDSIDIDVLTRIPGSGEQMVTVNQTDSFSVAADLGSLSFESVTGVFAGTTADFDGISETLDVPDGFDNVELMTAILALEVENGVDMPGSLDLLIQGSNGKSITLTGDILPRGTEPFRLSTITNEEVADFLSPLPEQIDITGTIQFGDGVYHGTIRNTDYIFARANFFSPLEVRVNNAEVTDLEITKEEIEQDDIELITDHVVSARFVYSITNHLPLGVTAIVHLSGDSSSLYSSPQLTLDTLIAAPAPVSLATGTATASADTVCTGELALDSLDIQILKNDTLFVRQQLYLVGSDSSGVRLTANDYIIITGRIEVEYRFDGEF